MKKSKKWEHERDILEAQREKALPEIKRLVSELLIACPYLDRFHFFSGLRHRIERYGDLQYVRWGSMSSFRHHFNYRYDGCEKARGLANTLIVLMLQLKELEDIVSEEYKKTQQGVS
jgi:hypothetical protein